MLKLQANQLGSCTACCNLSGQQPLLRVTHYGQQFINLAAAYRLGDVTRCVWGQHIFDLARHCHCGLTVKSVYSAMQRVDALSENKLAILSARLPQRVQGPG